MKSSVGTMLDASSMVCGAVLAGGQSRRMGRRSKSGLEIGGATLLDRVVSRIRPQVDRLFISSNQPVTLQGSVDTEPRIADLLEGYGGPLIGIFSCLRHLDANASCDWLAVVPCDAPFLPSNLVAALLEQSKTGNSSLVSVRYKGIVQPTFSLWHKDLLPQLHSAVFTGRMHGIMEFLDAVDFDTVAWPGQSPSPFFNVNTPEDLAVASAQAASHGELFHEA